MPVIWTANARYRQVEYENEADLEASIIQVQDWLFGEERYYLDVKKKIGIKGSIQNIPLAAKLKQSGTERRCAPVYSAKISPEPDRLIESSDEVFAEHSLLCLCLQ